MGVVSAITIMEQRGEKEHRQLAGHIKTHNSIYFNNIARAKR